MLQEYDVVALSEVKTALPVRMPGYVTYQGKAVGSAGRGGIVILVKNWLSDFVYNVDITIEDQIWLQLRNMDEVLFGFCYVPPL